MRSNTGRTLDREQQMREAQTMHLLSWPTDKALAQLHWKWLQAEYAISQHHNGTIKPEAKSAEKAAKEAMQTFLEAKANRRRR